MKNAVVIWFKYARRNDKPGKPVCSVDEVGVFGRVLEWVASTVVAKVKRSESRKKRCKSGEYRND